jgi:hypothetical protein
MEGVRLCPHWSNNTYEQVETEISDSATHTKRVSRGKIKPVAVEVSGDEDTVVSVLWDSRAH